MGIDPNDVINIVQRALALKGNAHISMAGRSKTLLSKLLLGSVDLIDYSSGKKALLGSNDKLIRIKFRKLLAKDSKDHGEPSEHRGNVLDI
jgi:hypothetical protein